MFVSWLLSFPYNKIWSKILVLSLILRSSISLMSLRRVILSTWNKWQRSKKWIVVSGSNLHSHRGLRNHGNYSWICAHSSDLNPIGASLIVAIQWDYRFQMYRLVSVQWNSTKHFQRQYMTSSSFHSVMTFGKKEFLKYSVLHIKDGTCVISSIIKMINWWN